MSVYADAGSSVVLGTSGDYIYYDSHGCTGIMIKCMSGSAATALVHVDGVHADGVYYPIVAGAEQEFILKPYGIRRVHVKGSGGNATVSWTVSER